MKAFSARMSACSPLAALGLMVGVGATPLAAQTADSDCSRRSGAERVECLRRALAEAERELERAEREVAATGGEARIATPAAPATLGSEQVARRAGVRPTSAEAERLLAMIVASERTHPNRLQVYLEDGQVWRQIQGDTQVVELRRDARLSAEIWPSGLGGYRMRLPSIGRVLKVERIR